MNTRSSRSKARRGNVADAPIEISDDSISIIEPKRRKTEGPEIITLDEDLQTKSKATFIKPEVQRIDDDVITLEDEEEEITCLEEPKTTSSVSTRSRQRKEPPAAGGEKAEEQSRVVTRRQRVQKEAAPSPTRSPVKPSKPVETVQSINNPVVMKSTDVPVGDSDNGILTRRQRTLGITAKSAESSPSRQNEERNEVKKVSNIEQPNNKETPKEKENNIPAIVKEELVQPKTEKETTAVAVATTIPIATRETPSSPSLVTPKTEEPPSENMSAVVVKTQPPEEEMDTTEPESRLAIADDDEEVEGGPEHIRKIFIGRMDRRTTYDTLKQYFERWGKIVDICLPMDRFTNKSRGFAFITFTKARMVDAVQNARPHRIDGRVLDPKRAVPKWESHKPQSKLTVKTAFLYGLKGQITEKDLEEYFTSFGKVLRCSIIQRRGIGFVEFDDYDPVDKIFLQKTHRICGKTVGTEKAIGKKQMATPWNRRQRMNGSVWQNNYGNPQRWTGMNPRGNQFSRRLNSYYMTDSWRGYGNGYQNRLGGGPVRNYYTQRHSPYGLGTWRSYASTDNGYQNHSRANYLGNYYSPYSCTGSATTSDNQRVGYSSGSVVLNWSTSSTQRGKSSGRQGSPFWGRSSYSSFNISHANPSQNTGRSRAFSGLFAFPLSGSSHSYNYSIGRR